jgi:hypothetical protein
VHLVHLVHLVHPVHLRTCAPEGEEAV